jgi:predicted dehydrogenase
MQSIHRITRRSFVKVLSAAAAAPAIIPASARGAEGTVAPSERITLGLIGSGDHGVNWNLRRFFKEPDVQVIAVCDVDRSRREGAKKAAEEHYGKTMPSGTYKGCDAYNDFREILARDDIDAVMVATPDHWHVIPAIMAARAGKDVMCEKPLSLSVVEGRILANTVKSLDRISQTASENRSVDVYHRMAELVRNGRIGELKEIKVTLPSGHSVREAKMEFEQPPEGFDYNFWLGQAPYRPYCEARCHWNFRWILDYSGGMLTDWGAHMIDLAQWGNDTEHTGPVEVEGKATFPMNGLYDTATEFSIDYLYANGVNLNVSSEQPGIRFIGTEGWVGNTGWRAELQAEPASILDSKIGEDEIHLYTEPGGEQRNFLDGIRKRKPCYAPFEIGHRTITIAHIGNISMMLGRKLKWNPDKEQFEGDDEANGLLKRAMREPWTMENVLAGKV